MFFNIAIALLEMCLKEIRYSQRFMFNAIIYNIIFNNENLKQSKNPIFKE